MAREFGAPVTYLEGSEARGAADVGFVPASLPSLRRKPDMSPTRLRVREGSGNEPGSPGSVYTGPHLTQVSADTGMLAGRLRVRHYHCERMAVSLADCLAAATALSTERALAPADPSLANLIRAEAGNVHALPDTHGRPP